MTAEKIEQTNVDQSQNATAMKKGGSQDITETTAKPGDQSGRQTTGAKNTG